MNDWNERLDEYIDGLQTELNAIGEAINTTFFATRPETHAMRQTQSQT